MFKIRYLTLVLLLLASFRTAAGEVGWQPLQEPLARSARAAEHSLRHYRVDKIALRARLRAASLRRQHEPPAEIELPLPDGGIARYRVIESPIMDPQLAQRYPDFKSYEVVGIDDPSASGRLDITPRGFHAMLYTAQGRLFIDPLDAAADGERYAARGSDAAALAGYSCGVDEHDFARPSSSAARPAARISGSFLEYRLAVAATAEYVARVGGGVSAATAAIFTAVNRVNAIYQRDLGIRLTLVANDGRLIENGGNVIFSDGNPAAMFIENQLWLDSQLGRGGYDVGHVFGTAGGGLAFLGGVCDTRNKAKGVSAIPNPLGDPFYIDFVAHEIGHQFNADHSFNGTTQNCASGRNAATAFEPGSGSTIMGYAGICGFEDLQQTSDATFHAGSIVQIDAFTRAGGSCYTQIPASPVNPSEPIVAAVAAKTIPANTAFVLDASASDADGDALTFQWDQMDAGCPTDSRSFGTDIGSNSLFRSYPPRGVSSRHFPALGTQLQGLYDDAEVVPCNNRDLDFRVTVRDVASSVAANGLASSDTRISVSDTGAVFEITNFNSGGILFTTPSFNVFWRVAGTNGAPINCSNVDIDLLTFAPGYASYTVNSLESATPNDGAELVTFADAMKTKSHPRARIRVKCSDNYFYDISNVDFAVQGTGAELFDDSANPVFFNNNGTTGGVAPACGAVVECPIDSGDSDGGGGGGASPVDYRWLLPMAALIMLAGGRRRRNSGVRACSEP